MFYPCENSSQNPKTNTDEPTLANQIDQYTLDNTKTGFLVFQVFQDSPIYGILPIANAKVTVNKLIDKDVFVSKILETNIDGETEPLPLPTVSENLSMTPEDPTPYSIYFSIIEAPNFQKKEIYNIPIYDDVTMIQPVQLTP